MGSGDAARRSISPAMKKCARLHAREEHAIIFKVRAEETDLQINHLYGIKTPFITLMAFIIRPDLI